MGVNMGLLDSIMGKGDSSEAAAKKAPFTMATSFRPMRLAGKSHSSVELLVELHNISQETLLCSFVVEVPKGISFDNVGIHKSKEIRMGQVQPGEKKEISVNLAGSNTTMPGLYRLQLSVYSHYRDYSHVLNTVSKTVELRVV